jgi:putative membrane protein
MFPNYLFGLPHFFIYFAMALLLLGVFWSIYTFLTPHDEIALIKQGNIAAAITCVGALIGFAIPVASAALNNVSPMALCQWGVVAMLVQWSVFSLLRLAHRDLMKQIQDNNIAMAIFAAGTSISIGILNAAAMSF